MLEHVEGYEEVTRVGACLDSAGYQFAIVERMDCTLRALKVRGRQISSAASKANAVEHLITVSGKGVSDTHDYNIMKRRKKDEFVLVDCLLN